MKNKPDLNYDWIFQVSNLCKITPNTDMKLLCLARFMTFMKIVSRNITVNSNMVAVE